LQRTVRALPTATRHAQRPAPVLHFRLTKKGPLHVAVSRPSACHAVLTFTRTGHSGANTLRLPARLARRLAPGSYRLVVRSGGRVVAMRGLVVRHIGLVQARLVRAPAMHAACAAGGVASAIHTASARPAADAATRTPNHVPAATHRAVSAADFPHPKRPQPFPHQVLSTVFTKQLEQAPAWLRPIMLGFLAAAILLLGAASLPQRVLPDGRAVALLERRRLGLALSGAVVVVAIAIADLLS
jgi:hypothetical protein